jgi:L-ribulose-5-phosphate 3-epimerase
MTDFGQIFAINTYGYTLTHGARDCLEHLAGRGYRAFELMMYPGHLWPKDLDAGERAALRRLIESRDLRIVTINMPNVDLNIGGASSEMREYSLGLLEGFVALAGDLGAAGMVLGPGKDNPLLPMPRERILGHFHRALDRLVPRAERAGIGLWAENMPFAFLPDADSLMAALDGYGSDVLGVTYDIPNAVFIKEDPKEGLRRVRSRLKLVHLSDTPLEVYRHDPVGQGVVDFAELPPVLDEVGYRELPMLEIIASAPDEAIADSCRRLAPLFAGSGRGAAG